MSCKLRFAIAALAMACSTAGSAAELLIGQVGAFSTPQSPSSQLRIGAQAYFDAVNAGGGVHGATLRLISKDRGLDTADAVLKTRELLGEVEPLALLGMAGTGPMEALVKSGVLADAGVPVVGIRTGAVSLHEPVNPLLFHTRANYAGEVDKIVAQLATIGLHRVAVFHENSFFGKEGLALIERSVKSRPKMQLAGSATYEPNTTRVEAALGAIRNAAPQGIVMVANSPAAAEFYKQWRAGGGAAQVIALSVVDGAEVVKLVGKEAASGLIVTQVVPEPSNRAMPLVQGLHHDFKKYAPPGMSLNQTVLEGYLSAKVLVEAIRIAGPNPTRKRLRSALEAMRAFDAGGVVIGFSPSNHTGSKFVELAIIIRSGKLMR